MSSQFASLRATESQIEALNSFSTCEISDALIKLGVPTGGLIPDLDALSPIKNNTGRIIGEAYTVKMVPQTEKDAPKLDGHFIDLAPSGSIIVISSPPGVKSASLGGLLALSAHVKGVTGAVIDGRCRDLTEMHEMGFPVYGRGHSTLGQSPFTRPSEIQIPIEITPTDSTSFEPTRVNPYDVIVADIDGVVVVEPASIDQVVQLAAKGREVDEKCRQDLAAGKGVKETFKKHRE